MNKRKKSPSRVSGEEGVAARLRLTARLLQCRLTAAPRGERTWFGLRSQDGEVKFMRSFPRRFAQARINVRQSRCLCASKLAHAARLTL